MTENMRIWDAVSKTDPKQTKSFKRAGGFSGTAIKPIWLTKRLTEQFGPAGTGWGMEQPVFQTVTAGNEILVFCTVALWYMDGDRRGTVYGVGGDKVLGTNKYGPFTNDEAFKASYTDALSNAMKQIGMGADIHMGQFEDEKYVRETAREFANGPGGAASTSIEEARKEIAAITGNDKSTYRIGADKKAAANAKAWTDAAIETLNFANTTEDVEGWWRDNAKPLAKLEENHPDQYERICLASDNAREATKAKAA